MRRHLHLAIFMCIGLSSGLIAQHIEPVFPRPGSKDVSISTWLHIRSQQRIDAQRVALLAQNNPAYEEYPITLIPESVTRTVPRHGWKKYSIRGKLALVTPYELTFTPNAPLQHGVTYMCIVERVPLEGGIPSITFEIRFTTAAQVPIIAASTFDSTSVLGCRQPIYMRIVNGDRDLYARATSFTKITSNDRHISTVVSFSNDNQYVMLRPVDTWPQGAGLRMEVLWARYTGNSYDDRTWTGVVRGATQVRVRVQDTSGRDMTSQFPTLVKSNSVVVPADGTLLLSTPQKLSDNWRFAGWKLPPYLSDSVITTAVVRKDIPCANMEANTIVTMIVAQSKALRIPFRIDNGLSVVIYDTTGTVVWRGMGNDSYFMDAKAGPQYAIVRKDSTNTISTPQPRVSGPWHTTAQRNSSYTLLLWEQLYALATEAKKDDHRSIEPIDVTLDGNSSMKAEYSLSGKVVDIESLDDADAQAGTTFLTRDYFESEVAGERTLCVRAHPCWRIVSATITNTGKTIQFPEGSTEACVTEKMTPGENTVVFNAKRVEIPLRIDMTLLKSYDANDILVGKAPHPDAIVMVERKVRNRTPEVWDVLAYTTCTDNQIAYRSMSVKCGDQLRFTVRGSKARSQQFVYWSTPDNYTTPAFVRSTPVGNVEVEYVYMLTVGKEYAKFQASRCSQFDPSLNEIRMRACFEQRFGIEAISARLLMQNGEGKQNCYFKETWLDPMIYYDRVDGEVKGGRQIEYVPRYGTIFKTRFTLPIDIQSVYQGGIRAFSYGNVDPQNPTTNEGFMFRSYNGDHVSFAPLNGEPINTVEFRICEPGSVPRKQAMYFGSFDVNFTTDIKSYQGQKLQTNAMFVMQSMERSGYALNLQRAARYDDEDPDVWPFVNRAEVYNAFYGAFLGQQTAHGMDRGFMRYPVCLERNGVVPDNCTFSYTDRTGEYNFGNLLLLFEPSWIGDKEFVFTRVMTYDEDCQAEDNCLVNNVYDLLGRVSDKLQSYMPQKGDEPKDLSWESILPDLIDEGVKFIRDLMPIDQQDELLGEYHLLLGGENRWGVVTPTYPRLRCVHENGYYDYSPKLYVRRPVVR